MKYDEDSNIGYFLEVEVESPERVGKLHNNMSFSQKKWSLQKTDKLVCNLNNKDSYVVHLKTFKEVVDYELKLEKVHRATELNQQPLMNQQWLCEQCCVR